FLDPVAHGALDGGLRRGGPPADAPAPGRLDAQLVGVTVVGGRGAGVAAVGLLGQAERGDLHARIDPHAVANRLLHVGLTRRAAAGGKNRNATGESERKDAGHGTPSGTANLLGEMV